MFHAFGLLVKATKFASDFADIAQLVEQRIRNAWVLSSSLSIGSRPNLRPGHLFGRVFSFLYTKSYIPCTHTNTRAQP